MSTGRTSLIERLETRQLFSGGLVADNTRLIFDATSGGVASAAQSVNLFNAGTTPITIAAGGEIIDGADSAEFKLIGNTGASTQPIVIQPGASSAIGVQFAPTHIGPAGALLHVLTDDSTSPEIDITLRGLGVRGQFDTLEPSLQWILDTYQIPVNVGTSDPTQNVMDIVPVKPNDEVPMNLMEKAGNGPVVVTPIASFSSVASHDLDLGYYSFNGDSGLSLSPQYSVPATDVQSLNMHVIGTSQFDPGTSIFGLYTNWPGQKNRLVYTEDARNTWIADVRLKHAVRFYPMKNPDGSVVANTYVMAVEEGTNHDYQDGVFIVQNVRLANPSQSPSSLTVTTTPSRELILHWTNNALNASGVTLDRSVNGGPFMPVATLASNVSRYNDFNVDFGTRYAYRVRATGIDGVSDYAKSVATLVPVTYQAESAILSGPIVQNAYAGFTGTGYAAFQNPAGDSIHWQSSVSQTNAATLTFRYANGAATSAPLQLSINGVIVKASLSFAATGTWGTWRSVSINVVLNAGVNDIVLSTVGAGGPIIDSLTVR